MSSYIYYWDNDNKKKRYGGKYEKVSPQARGYYGSADAGNKQDFEPKDSGVKRHFIGSETQEYTFSDRIRGTLTITASSYEEALRIAESRGYTASDYRKRPRGRRGK